jgi:hypothetical protein
MAMTTPMAMISEARIRVSVDAVFFAADPAEPAPPALEDPTPDGVVVDVAPTGVGAPGVSVVIDDS